MKKNLAAFSLMKDLCPSTWDIEYPEAINTKLQYAESRNYPEINAADFHDYIISGLIMGGFPALARQLFDQCEENGFQKSEKLYNLMAQGHFTVALPSIDQGKFMISCLLAKGLKVYRKTYLDYISALYAIDKKDELMEVIGILFKKYGVDLPTYTLLLKLNLPIEGVQSHSDLLAHMLRNQVKPDARFFCVLLNNISKKGSYSDILEVFEISRNHIRPTVGMYSIFIKSLVKLDQMDEAEKWIVRMIQDRCKPNRVTYSTLMNAYLQKGNFSRGLYYFGKMIGYQFHDNTLAFLSPSERADNTAIWSLLNYMLNNGMIETLQFVFGKTLSAGFKLQNWRTVQIVDILLGAGYLWPIVLIPDFKNSVDQMNSLIKAESLVAMSSASDEHQDHILVKLEKKLQDFAHSIHGGPILIRYQWVIVKLLTEKTLLNQFFEENEMQYAKYTLQLILIRIVHSRVDFNALTISVDKEPLQIFLNDIDKKLSKDKLGKFAAPVLPFELPSFRPKITDNSTNENDDAIIELAPPYFEKKTIPRVETVSTIATDMFPLLVGCVSLYHSFNPILKNSSTSTVENQLPSHLPQVPYQTSNPVNVGLNPKLALKDWNVSKNMLLKLTSDQEMVVKAALVHLVDKNEIINRENIDKACEQLAMTQPELKSVFKWLSKYNFRSSLVKKYKNLVYQ
jgi:pentatricopeptide repeat protein